MTDFTRLNILLKASAGQNANRFKPLDHDSTHATPKAYIPVILRPVSASLLEGLIYNIKHDKPLPRSPLTSETKAGLEHILHLLDESITTTSSTMANRFPSLTTSDLPRASPEEAAATASPARGTAMLNSIFKSVRVPEFRHKWLFWAEKGQSSTPKDKSTTSSEDFASRPKPLGETIISVKEFYQHFNNIPVENLRLRDSIHLFHLGIKPVWEDPRNTKGGAWYFKVSKETASQFWHEICLLAVGDILQGAVETKRASFNDDICGITYSARWNAVQIAVWNRDADNEAGREKLLKAILEKLSDELRPKKEDSYWYKAHKEHKGFIEQ